MENETPKSFRSAIFTDLKEIITDKDEYHKVESYLRKALNRHFLLKCFKEEDLTRD